MGTSNDELNQIIKVIKKEIRLSVFGREKVEKISLILQENKNRDSVKKFIVHLMRNIENSNENVKKNVPQLLIGLRIKRTKYGKEIWKSQPRISLDDPRLLFLFLVGMPLIVIYISVPLLFPQFSIQILTYGSPLMIFGSIIIFFTISPFLTYMIIYERGIWIRHKVLYFKKKFIPFNSIKKVNMEDDWVPGASKEVIEKVVIFKQDGKKLEYSDRWISDFMEARNLISKYKELFNDEATRYEEILKSRNKDLIPDKAYGLELDKTTLGIMISMTLAFLSIGFFLIFFPLIIGMSIDYNVMFLYVTALFLLVPGFVCMACMITTLIKGGYKLA